MSMPEGMTPPDFFLGMRWPGLPESRLPDKELRTAAPDDVPGKCKHEPEMTMRPSLSNSYVEHTLTHAPPLNERYQQHRRQRRRGG